jgi:hypothetical protein
VWQRSDRRRSKHACYCELNEADAPLPGAARWSVMEF